jgi:hypothetical protein
MLKITVIRSETETTLALEGKLVDPWLSEFERVWAETQSMSETHRVLIDLKDVTSISKRGQELLEGILTQGANLTCCRGVLTMHVVKGLMHRIGFH